MAMTNMDTRIFDRELKKGSAELLILSLIEVRARHGYDISKLIETRSGGALSFHVASLYPFLYRLEKRGWIKGQWVEKAGQRRRRYYKLTPEGRKVLATQRSAWESFVAAINRITGIEHARMETARSPTPGPSALAAGTRDRDCRGTLAASGRLLCG